MISPSRFSTPKKPTNVSLPSDLVDEAKQLGINVSQACESGLADKVKTARAERWLEENRESLLAWNEWVSENGMLYDEYRQL
ncbi:type II toxin-antitoxin system CcdA family antitoxin [Sphingorhabdus sp.]|uniref:type II toxin-antitoxin system CcdA family antitoxin n=1 Tax=Sphingorhabdus sp. TaxID=1902408 RepID=UPI0032B75431